MPLSRRNTDDPAKTFFEGRAATYKPDIGVSVHVNASGGNGFEVYHPTEKNVETSKALCQSIADEVKNIGQQLRSPVLRTTTALFGTLMNAFPAPYAYCEMGFIDNEEDYRRFDTEAEQKKFGIAYAKGILKYLGITWKA